MDAAKADGRWDAAYARIRSAGTDSIAEDLRLAIEAGARTGTFRTLSRPNHFALRSAPTTW